MWPAPALFLRGGREAGGPPGPRRNLLGPSDLKDFFPLEPPFKGAGLGEKIQEAPGKLQGRGLAAHGPAPGPQPLADGEIDFVAMGVIGGTGQIAFFVTRFALFLI